MEIDKGSETVFKYEGEHIYLFSNPIALSDEIDKNLAQFPNIIIKRAFINHHNKRLYIITDDLNTIEILSKFEWPNKAFNTGIKNQNQQKNHIT